MAQRKVRRSPQGPPAPLAPSGPLVSGKLTAGQEARLRLRVEFIIRIAVNFLAFGVITPVTAFLFDPVAVPDWVVIAVFVGFTVFAFVLYTWASYLLKGLD